MLKYRFCGVKTRHQAVNHLRKLQSVGLLRQVAKKQQLFKDKPYLYRLQVFWVCYTALWSHPAFFHLICLSCTCVAPRYSLQSGTSVNFNRGSSIIQSTSFLPVDYCRSTNCNLLLSYITLRKFLSWIEKLVWGHTRTALLVDLRKQAVNWIDL